MWEIDRSASRGLMCTRGLYVFEHDSMLGNAQATNSSIASRSIDLEPMQPHEVSTTIAHGFKSWRRGCRRPSNFIGSWVDKIDALNFCLWLTLPRDEENVYERPRGPPSTDLRWRPISACHGFMVFKTRRYGGGSNSRDDLRYQVADQLHGSS